MRRVSAAFSLQRYLAVKARRPIPTGSTKGAYELPCRHAAKMFKAEIVNGDADEQFS